MTIEEEIVAFDDLTRTVAEIAKELVEKGYSLDTVRCALYASRNGMNLKQSRNIYAIKRGFNSYNDYTYCMRLVNSGIIKNKKGYLRRRKTR
ncbi:hypothetical protein J4402_04140 [Candidatus Pacearchaeota archaeon]|nr:hypothetical protein [Candidatus Pacearchaeota archaeon]